MGRRKTAVRGRRVAFSTRHMRADHRDELRVLGEELGLNMEEALDLALTYGLKRMRKKVEAEMAEEEQSHDARGF